MFAGVTLSPRLLAGATVRVKVCAAGLPTPFVAVMMMVNVPDAVAVPLRVAEPLRLSAKEMPLGNAPDSVRLEIGKPVVVTMNEPGTPTVNAALLALVIAGA